MNSIRIAVVSALTVGAVLAGVTTASHSVHAQAGHVVALSGSSKASMLGPIPCCGDES